MGMTVIEKIASVHTRDPVRPGSIVWMDLDVRSARDFGGPNVVRNFRREYGSDILDDPRKTFFTFDLCAPACSIRYADNQQLCREFAREKDMRVFDVDQGIGSHVMIEEGLAGPGKTVVGTDSHMNILGAVGCFGQGMGDVDIAFAFKTGKTWFEIPKTVKVNIRAENARQVTPKDLTLFILKHLGTRDAALRAVEFYGPAVEALSLSGRITLCSMITEMAGIIGFIPESPEFESGDFRPDSDAEYADIIEIDISGIEPQVSAPFSPENVFPISELKGRPIHSGFIGSCTNGRMEDFEEALNVLRGRRVKEGVMLKMVPATRRVYRELLKKDMIAELVDCGAIISNPGCGGCAEGHIGLTGKGEVQISTGNRNFAGKQGRGEIYLAGPAVAAASCLAGEIAGPEDV